MIIQHEYPDAWKKISKKFYQLINEYHLTHR